MCVTGICVSLPLPKNGCVEYHPPYFIRGPQRRSPNKLMCSNLQRCRPVFASMRSSMLMHFACYGLWHVLSEWCVASIPITSFTCPLASRFSQEKSHCHIVWMVSTLTEWASFSWRRKWRVIKTCPTLYPLLRGAIHYSIGLWMCIALNRIALSMPTLFTIDEWYTSESKCVHCKK